MTCAHATFTTCIFDACDQVEIDGNTTMTGATIRNGAASTKGLYIQTAPADYSAIDVTFADNSGDDITINPSSAGTFTLTGIVKPSGTLNIYNESATHAITVEIPAGITYATDTAGGTVTVSQPQTTFTITSNVTAEITILTTGTTTVEDEVETNTTLAYTFSAPLGNNVDIQVFAPGYYPYWEENRDLGSADSSLSVTLEADPAYVA